MKIKLKVDPAKLWDKCGFWITNHDLVGHSIEDVALAIINGKSLTKDELAFMLIVATETLSTRSEEKS